jgi:hypothetical protein
VDPPRGVREGHEAALRVAGVDPTTTLTSALLLLLAWERLLVGQEHVDGDALFFGGLVWREWVGGWVCWGGGCISSGGA